MASGKGKILIIEDDRYISKMYQLKLNIEGYEVEVAENGKIGYETSQKFLPEIILLDILMPEMDGFETLKALKGNASTKNIPVLIMSNLGQEDHIQKGKELGAIGYIVKTQYTPAKVVETIKEVLGKSTVKK